MHLLAGQPQAVETGEAVDLGQSPGEIVVLSAADSELACLAAARARLGPEFPSLRLASLRSLGHHLSVDLYADAVLARAKLVVVRLLGGAAYWPYGAERLVALARAGGPRLALLPGDDKPDASLEGLSTLPAETLVRLQRFCAEGGVDNAENLLRYAATLVGRDLPWREPATLPTAGFYRPERRRDGAPVAAILFYRALSLAGDLEPVDALIEALGRRGLDPLPIFVASLREPASAALLAETFAASPPDIVLNATAFASGMPLPCDCPVLQVVFAGASEEGWRAGSQGLGPRDLAMHVALPEVDGRVLSRAVSFKAEAHVDALTECPVVRHRVVPDRVEFVAELAANWSKLRRKPEAERRVAIVLANYPNREGRVGNGVGLDTPAGVLNALRALRDAGYAVRDLPADGAELIARLQAATDEEFSLADYQISLGALPPAARDKVVARWGGPEDAPGYRPGALDCGRFAIRAVRFGAALVAVQPSRGYDLDPRATAHDPDLPPPHGYLAFYWFLRWGFRCDAVVHFGKHGNMEWLPGKALALSAECFPEAALGPLPHLYPFIVNDPGEGSQAKRRSAAVIVDHLTPPLARAELYGPLKRLEALVDEYYEAARLDPRRCKPLEAQILAQAASAGVDVAGDEPLKRIDAQLCELKELQIRDGLHVFGESPQGEQRDALLVALARAPRPGGASLLRALAEDQGLAFDPLAGERDVEALESLALDLVAGRATPAPDWPRTTTVLREIADELKPALDACGAAELAGLLRGLDGCFVAPGPSGAPTRGRPEVLPTGRNFYSVDTRAVPTPTAWALGWKSAALLLERHRQEEGDWPRRVALSAWGTSNMRTGGDDIAQALALMGVRPAWEATTGRVSGFEVMPIETLDRPRVDVTLRVSGFFRDAFPAQIELLDAAVRAVAALDEAEALNPLAAQARTEAARLRAAGASEETAWRRATFRIFGAMPGAYGAGLQALVDSGAWEDEGELAEAFLAWGGFAYGRGAEGASERALFAERLAGVEAVLHNQDNREHDLLDSDDYYQFEGGLALTVRRLAGRAPVVWHNDHSRLEFPRPRRLEEELNLIVRGRAANPKWLRGVMRHGYKGGFEIAATVDYLFAFAATTKLVRDEHFEALYDAYLGDPAVREFLRAHNPAALREIAQRFAEAARRGLWRPRANSVPERLKELGA